MDPKISINLDHYAPDPQEFDDFYQVIKRLTIQYVLPREKIIREFFPNPDEPFVLGQLQWMQLSLVIGVVLDNLEEFFDVLADKSIGKNLALFLEASTRIPKGVVTHRFRASGVHTLEYGDDIFLSLHLDQDAIADAVIDHDLALKNGQDPGKITCCYVNQNQLKALLKQSINN